MRMRHSFTTIVLVLASGLLFNSCSNVDATPASIIFNQTEGKANSQGEYIVNGRIQSEVALSKVIITKEGSSSPWICK